MPDRKTSENVQLSFLAVTQVTFGCALGILLGGAMSRASRKIAALSLFSVGSLFAAPLITLGVMRAWRKSEGGARLRLEKIRRNPGFAEGGLVL